MDTLFSWIGTQDFQAVNNGGVGPVCAAIKNKKFKKAILISNSLGDPNKYSNKDYKNWLQKQTNAEILIENVVNDDPTDIDKIFELSEKALKTYKENGNDMDHLWFHLSPGTWAMSVSWMLLSQKEFPARLIKSSVKDNTVSEVEIPFEVSVQWLSKIYENSDKFLKENQNKILGIEIKSLSMERLFSKAFKFASRELPIYIEGEPGTEKLEMAKSIHEISPRKNNQFVSIDCALSLSAQDLITKLFGHDENDGGPAFSLASQGTLYIQSIETMPKECQKLLLAHLENSKSNSSSNSPRIIVSSRENLMNLVETGDFLEDLMHAISILILKIPPLRERGEDLNQIITKTFEEAKKLLPDDLDNAPKEISPGAMNYLFNHPWPGNMNELKTTLQRIIERKKR